MIQRRRLIHFKRVHPISETHCAFYLTVVCNIPPSSPPPHYVMTSHVALCTMNANASVTASSVFIIWYLYHTDCFLHDMIHCTIKLAPTSPFNSVITERLKLHLVASAFANGVDWWWMLVVGLKDSLSVSTPTSIRKISLHSARIDYFHCWSVNSNQFLLQSDSQVYNNDG